MCSVFYFSRKIKRVSEPSLLLTVEYPIVISLAASVLFRSLTQSEFFACPFFCDEYLITSSVVQVTFFSCTCLEDIVENPFPCNSTVTNMAFGFIKTHEDLIEPHATGDLYITQRNHLIFLHKRVTRHFPLFQIQIFLLAHTMQVKQAYSKCEILFMFHF